MSRTSPTPFAVDFASTRAARIASLARLNAVWKPKLWSISGMSLSMVLGMPTTAIRRPRSPITRTICIAPRIEPSPPMTNSMLMLSRSRQSTISSGSWGPREVPSTVPPSTEMSRTVSGFSSMTSWP